MWRLHKSNPVTSVMLNQPATNTEGKFRWGEMTTQILKNGYHGSSQHGSHCAIVICQHGKSESWEEESSSLPMYVYICTCHHKQLYVLACFSISRKELLNVVPSAHLPISVAKREAMKISSMRGKMCPFGGTFQLPFKKKHNQGMWAYC